MNLQGHTQTSVLVLAKELFYYLMIKLKNLINQKFEILLYFFLLVQRIQIIHINKLSILFIY